MEFQVIASEDWKGTRPDTKVPSEKAKFRVDYTPKVDFTVYSLHLLYTALRC